MTMPNAQADTEHVMNALAHAMTGDRASAGAELSAVYSKSPRHMYAVWVMLAETAVHSSRQDLKDDEWMGLLVQHDGAPASIDDAPPAVALTMRFMTAQANNDSATTQALLKAAMAGADPDVLADGMSLLLDAAVISAKEQIAARRTKEA